MTAARAKPFPGHKRGNVLRGFVVSCECGWKSSVWHGQGGMKNANAEWRWHIGECRKVAEAGSATGREKSR